MTKLQGDYCFRDRESFRSLLDRSSQNTRTALYEKWNAVDFDRQMALLVVEEHATGGYDVEIEAIWKTPTEILVEIRDLVPPPAALLTQAFTHPWAAAVVNRSELPVRFLRRVTVRGEP